MAQNVIIKGDWSNVPEVVLNKAGGGKARFVDTSPTTATDSDVAAGKVYFKANGDQSTGTGSGGGGATLQTKSVTYTPTTSQQTDEVTPDSGYDGLSKVNIQVNAVPTGTAGTPTATKGAVDPVDAAVLITPSVTNTTGYITGGTKTGTPFYVTAAELVEGNEITIDDSGEWDVARIETAVVPEGSVTNPAMTISTSGLITATTTLTEGWIQSGTKTGQLQLTKRTSSDLTANGATVTAPAGYYPSAASKTVASGSATTPTATITANPEITVGSNGLITATVQSQRGITPTVVEGWVSQGTSGQVSASGSSTKQMTVVTANDIGGHFTGDLLPRAEVTVPPGYVGSTLTAEPFDEMTTDEATAATVDSDGDLTVTFSPETAGVAFTQHTYTLTKAGAFNVQAGSTIAPTESQQTAVPADTLTRGAVNIGAISSTYVGSGITRRSSSDMSMSGAVVTAPAGYYTNAATYTIPQEVHTDPTVSINSNGLITATHTQPDSGFIAAGTTTGTLQLTKRTSADVEITGNAVNVPAGYYHTGTVKTIPAGSAATPATTITATPSLSIDWTTGEITATVSATKNITPTVTEGYVSSGTSGTVTVSGSDTLSQLAIPGTTITPSRSQQTAAPARAYVKGDIYVAPIPSEYIIPSGSDTVTQNGTVDVTSLAELIVNVAATGGLEYETGTWTPTSDIARGSISFSKNHTEPPIGVLLSDTTGTAHSATNSNYLFVWIDPDGWKTKGYPYSSSGYRYAAAFYGYRGSSTSSISAGGYFCSQRSSSSSASGASYPKYWVTNTNFHPYSNSSSRYWRSGRSFSWIAVWAPT